MDFIDATSFDGKRSSSPPTAEEIIMKFAIATAALILTSFPASANAELVPQHAATRKCGNAKAVCVSAREAHILKGYKVSALTYCGGQATFCRNMVGYTYRYWRR